MAYVKEWERLAEMLARVMVTGSSRDIFGHRRRGEFEAQFEQFTMDPGSAPQRVFPVHPPDQIAQFAIDPRSSCAGP